MRKAEEARLIEHEASTCAVLDVGVLQEGMVRCCGGRPGALVVGVGACILQSPPKGSACRPLQHHNITNQRQRLTAHFTPQSTILLLVALLRAVAASHVPARENIAPLAHVPGWCVGQWLPYRQRNFEYSGLFSGSRLEVIERLREAVALAPQGQLQVLCDGCRRDTTLGAATV